MSVLRHSQGDPREERGIAEFKQKWPSMQGKYEALTAYVWKLSNEMLARDKIPGYASPRPGGGQEPPIGGKDAGEESGREEKAFHTPERRDRGAG